MENLWEPIPEDRDLAKTTDLIDRQDWKILRRMGNNNQSTITCKGLRIIAKKPSNSLLMLSTANKRKVAAKEIKKEHKIQTVLF